MNKKHYTLLPFASILLLIAVWYALSLALNVEFLLPNPASTFKQLIGLFAQKQFYLSVLGTAVHSVLAFLLAFTFAFGFALLSYFFEVFEKLFYPLTVIMRVMPTMSIIFLSIVWLSSKNSPYLVCVCVLFPLLYSNVLNAFKGVDKDLIAMAKLYGVKKGDMIKNLYLTSIANSLYNDSINLLSFAVKLAISGEAIAQSGATLGFMLQSSKANLETGLLIAYTVVAVVLGFLMELAVKVIVGIIRRKKRVKI